ncbi:peroxiredoxin family protein [Priestia taiwanensis]|uniref:Thiol:disulfide interchange protein tlpA n=1 Tax=Priestia taiwanensis TaxID=1347902 RepID=A0A917AXM7_9BACI|nr:redoxin domain-containing protein [Priestia taiwanensis]MBM7365056.1 peroxiredoxin [Priestia taiwanensis]GGE83749.1 thiol:disulfide interchange protein tlpA [Priestia taiwanensis]
MKKIMIIMVLFGMLGWTVYELAFQTNHTLSSEVKEDKKEEVSSANETQKNEKTQNAIVGLNVGDIAPDFQLQTLDGKTAKLSDYRGKRVMVNFWATWCPPCRAEMPDMVKLYEEQNVMILAVNLTQTEPGTQAVQSFVNEFGLPFPILLDEEINVATQYEVRPIPTSYMIDSQGIIHYKALGALNHEMMVQIVEQMK